MRHLKSVLALLGAWTLSSPVQAQQAPAAGTGAANDEIVVTAQRRSENMQNVPIAITALNQTQLQAAGISDTFSLQNAVPGLNFTTALGSNALPNIRGVGTAAAGPGVENPVALYVDNVYIGSANQGLLALTDVEQVAVLKGPQGTLFGRNATGGLLQVTSRKPQHEFGGDVHVGAGNYSTFTGDAFVTGGLTDTLAASLSLYAKDQGDGYGKNFLTGNDVDLGNTYSGRLKFLWTPDANTEVTLSLDRSEIDNGGPVFMLAFGQPNGDGLVRTGSPWDVDLNFDPSGSVDSEGASLTVQHDFGDAVRFLSITADRSTQQKLFFDNDQSRVNHTTGRFADNEFQFSQELQLQSLGGGPLQWVVGAYYYKANGKYAPVRLEGPAFFFAPTGFGFAPGAKAIVVNTRQSTESLAGFAQATYKILPDTNITAGVRYTTDKKAFSTTQHFEYLNGSIVPFPDLPGPAPNLGVDFAADRFDRATWRASIDHRFSPNLLAYASFNTGFKSGLFNPATLPPQRVVPETLNAYEVGFKADLFDRTLRLNVAAYDYDYSNNQILFVFRGIGVLATAKSATMQGIDGDLSWRATEDLTITGGFSWTDATYDSFNNAPFTYPYPAARTLFPALCNPPPVGNPGLGGNCAVPGAFNASGNRMQLVPEYTINLGFTYDMPSSIVPENLGHVSLSSHYKYNDGWFLDPQNRQSQPSYQVVDAALTWTLPRNGWDIRLWGDNLTNEAYAAQFLSNDNGDQIHYAPPRTYGVTVGYSF